MSLRALAPVLLLGLGMPGAANAAGDDYATMLAWLTDSRIDGQALSAAQGSIKLNQAAGDLNLQLNAHALASGRQATTAIRAGAVSEDNLTLADAPLHARAALAGSALAGASGIASVNQASGQANAQLNALGLAVSATPATALQAPADNRRGSAQALRRTDSAGLRQALVGADALRGFAGVMQLNQIAGSSNVVENRLGLHVQTGP